MTYGSNKLRINWPNFAAVKKQRRQIGDVKRGAS